jgi:Tfp pilus assembly protein PilN
MIRINLLPPDVTITEHKINPNIIIGVVAGGLVTLLIPFTWAQYAARSRLRGEITSVQADLDRYRPIVAQVEALEAAKNQLQQRKTIIQNLESERLRYPYFMEDFIKLLPNNVWLNNMTTTLPPDGQTMNLSIDVIALDHYAVADLISNLETSQIFTDVDLGPLSMTSSATGGQSITFHINTIYRKAPSATPYAAKK